MLGRFFSSSPVLDEPSVLWLFDVYEWALTYLGRGLIEQTTPLVLPDNQFFPGKENSVEGMAQLILDQVSRYAGVEHWNCVAVNQASFQPLPLTALPALAEGLSARAAEPVPPVSMPVPYDPRLISDPEGFIAGYAHVISMYLCAIAPVPPPGGEENRSLAAEVVAVFLGFGVLMANTAYASPASCSSCRAGAATRMSGLSQFDLTFALAMFCELKHLPPKDARRHLKSPLRGYFSKCVKALAPHQRDLALLRCGKPLASTRLES